MAGTPPPPPYGGHQPPPPPGAYQPPPPPGAAAAPGPAPGPTAPPGPFGPPGSYVGYPGYGYPGAAVKAGFWARFAAFVIDGLILSVFGLPAQFALRNGATQIEQCPSGGGLCEVPTSGTWTTFAVLTILSIVAGFVYYVVLEGRSGQTVGKRALGIRVVDSRTGAPIGTGRAVGRYFARILSALPCYLGYFWMAWDNQRQTWHDKMVSSDVVKA